MSLIELLSVIDDDGLVVVYGFDDECGYLHKVAEYNGRDSIDERFNNRLVVRVFPMYSEYHYRECIGVEIAEG